VDWIKRLLTCKDLELHIATYKGDVWRVEELLEKGSDPNAQDYDGQTPLHTVASKGDVLIVELLLKHGADPNTQTKFGYTPLHLAAMEGHVDVVRLLLEHGADPTIKNKDGKTPLDLARAEGHREVFLVIEEWLRQKKSPSQQRVTAETRPSARGPQKAVSPPSLHSPATPNTTSSPA
jgi:ankyrin repeat protein